MTEANTAGGNAAAEPTEIKRDYVIESSQPEVKAEPAKEIPKAAEPTKTEGAEGDEAETDNTTDTGEGKKKRTGYQRKLDARDKEIARLNAELAGRPTAGEKAPEKAAAAADGEPKPEDFQTWGEYTKALAKHETKTAIKEAEEKRTNDARKAEETKTIQAKVETYKGQVTEARKVHEDFDDALNEYEGPQSEDLHKAIINSDHGAEVAYWLAKNPDEAETMRTMDKDALNRFIGRIEAKIEQGKVKEPPVVKTTKAPPPIKPVGKGAASESTDFPENGTYEEKKAWD